MNALKKILPALSERPIFIAGEKVRVLSRSPIGHYRVPIYLRGHTGVVVKVIEPSMIDNEEEGYGRNAGDKRHYYRISFPMSQLWPAYEGLPRDELHVEIFETWLEKIT
ncbi:SH3-like domain-containing protein [uncultured Hyphomonas sp.]|uniref:SH3-like domain-containing protein n=1 Tax=uncultured Hyphomonas sp. TaxID=225298 RepID=UPI002AAB6F64|nr:SH3-like domain-containing protein [uncultured Hyphomonas sp.]